jgi:hypothetical protein
MERLSSFSSIGLSKREELNERPPGRSLIFSSSQLEESGAMSSRLRRSLSNNGPLSLLRGVSAIWLERESFLLEEKYVTTLRWQCLTDHRLNSGMLSQARYFPRVMHCVSETCYSAFQRRYSWAKERRPMCKPFELIQTDGWRTNLV